MPLAIAIPGDPALASTLSMDDAAEIVTDEPGSLGTTEHLSRVTSARLAGSLARVLVADDDPDLLQLVAATMALSGYDVTRTNNGRDALRMLARGEFDLAVLDNFMPGLTGVTVIQELRRLTDVDQPAVLLLSAAWAPEDVPTALASGADGFLSKPFSLVTLQERVAALLEERRGRGGAAEGPVVEQSSDDRRSHIDPTDTDPFRLTWS